MGGQRLPAKKKKKILKRCTAPLLWVLAVYHKDGENQGHCSVHVSYECKKKKKSTVFELCGLFN